MAKRAPRNSWTEYVVKTIEPGESQSDVARRCGIDQTTISRWLHGQRSAITSQSVAKFARGYGQSVLGAFIAAGFLSPSEAGVKVADVVDWDRVSNDELLREMQRRLTEGIVETVTEVPQVADGPASS